MRASDLRVFLATLPLVFGGCADMCDNEISQSVVSPDGTLRAVVFGRNCGATTGFSTQLSIIPANSELPGEPGNVYIAENAIQMRLRWASETALEVSARPTGRVVLHKSNFNGVSVRYSGQNRL
jgi:hypothetical protein